MNGYFLSSNGETGPVELAETATLLMQKARPSTLPAPLPPYAPIVLRPGDRRPSHMMLTDAQTRAHESGVTVVIKSPVAQQRALMEERVMRTDLPIDPRAIERILEGRRVDRLVKSVENVYPDYVKAERAKFDRALKQQRDQVQIQFEMLRFQQKHGLAPRNYLLGVRRSAYLAKVYGSKLPTATLAIGREAARIERMRKTGVVYTPLPNIEARARRLLKKEAERVELTGKQIMELFDFPAFEKRPLLDRFANWLRSLK
jgi:hypothetical protein